MLFRSDITPINAGGPLEVDPNANIGAIVNQWKKMYQELAGINLNNQLIYQANNPKKKNTLTQ